ncbi:alpha-N-acetylglucosaminidase [Niastella yeongjuensis]|uniref:Alpha-N-acetylglucosaminidase n=1 Tax=Niastella yeongjuensis TaxID=354355 RepID=A0A1V9F7U9_9BACT|nr:alpha-N-acetylglucosaminidase [Niastella yeongjuensis]OQP54493.1 alpha-N-acetylglucosaminidase [Niastella yeongjuensis]SEN96806.1 alpha-N-acetylglucosaminidase [Niastella yeongjuensis]
MVKKIRIVRTARLILFLATLLPLTIAAQLNTKASAGLIKRVVPRYASLFIVEDIPAENDKDVFEVESRGKNIVLRGNNGTSIACALYHYLTEYCHCQITWNGTNLQLPATLPVVTKKVHKATPYTYRYYLNYCTFNYSMSWWDWERWQKEIDWMALHGINMPLAITGEEYTWYEVYKEMGFTDEELKDFFCGPAYFGWFWMGNLDAWGGPLPLNWMKSHKALQEKILQRERELGMKPVLPAFTGHVPPAFKKKYPNAKLKATNWTNGFADTYILDSQDPLFAEIGKRFLQKQTTLFGTDHLYSADTFNENEPPSDDPAFLSALSARIYEGMKQADTAATWVMQGWLFYSDRKFWKAPQIEALLKAVPDNKMILLDLAAEIEPVWKRTDAFYGKPWIWNMLHNFGGNVNLFGRMDGVAAGPAQALNDKASGKLWGIGLTMEAIEQNPVMYELMTQHTWQTTPVELDDWIPQYVLNRYRTNNKELVNAWQILRRTVYNGALIRDGAESIITGRPTFDSTTVWTRTKLNYAPNDLLPAWDLFIQAANKGVNTDGFQYDVVDVTRQALANYAAPLQKKWVTAFKEKDSAAFNKYSNAFLQLISDMDGLLATRKDFMLGPWLSTARSNGTTPAEKALYEQNARDLITLWGGANSPLHEYSNRQWSGLLNDFYKPRWQQFFTLLQQSLRTGSTPDLKQFEENIRNWEWQWVNRQNEFPTVPMGQPLQVAQSLYKKYRDHIN